jgi:GNAT superfamily N-acetyltransferase
MNFFTAYKNNFCISTDKSKLQILTIYKYLSEKSYWAKNIPLHIVQKSIDGSFCFGLYDGAEQMGFARVITDHATFAYLADVFILEAYRGRGLSKWLMQEIMHCPDVQGLRAWMLGTRDAHELYARFGFERVGNSERIMRYSVFKEY